MASGRTCATCGKPVPERRVNPAFPFCSPRCKLLDLGRWLGEAYRIPGGRPGDGGAPAAPPDPEEDS